ncbi:MAG: FTR1 family iron permease [Clostridia bacterium]|nr:FTR1 family iron permease [Clostridia bacterium]
MQKTACLGARSFSAALVLMLLLSMLPFSSLAEESALRWGSAADEIDRYCDTAFQYYLEGNTAAAFSCVNDAYFKVYEVTGFERQTMSYISGPRKNAMELQFSTCKAEVRKPNDTDEVRTEVRTALLKLKTMAREDANKLALKDGEALTETKYYYDGAEVPSDPWPQYGGDPNAKVQYKNWAEAYESLDELLHTSYLSYKGLDLVAAADNLNTAFYTVYEESGLDHTVYTDLSQETREAIDDQFASLRAILALGREGLSIKRYKNGISDLQSALKKACNELDAKAEAERAAALAETQAAAEAEAAANQSDPKLLTFFASFGIIVREGLEAILVIAAIIAYLVKSGNAKNLRNVYIGAILGIVASFAAAAVLAWAKAQWAGAGQSQEVIEGITALIAVCVLFYVSNWMISKAEAASWSRYIDNKVQSSVERGSGFALAFTAFLSVFREGAEVVLFYQPMLSEGNPGMVWAGFGAGCVVLVFVYLAITKLSIKLPIKVFFTATSILMAVMCVSFLGSGIKELAEGSVFDVTLRVPGIPENDVLQVLGIYPYLETLVPQLILAVILLVTFMIAHYRGKMDALRKELTAKE